MANDKKPLNTKLGVAVQTLIGFALIALGAYLMLSADVLATAPVQVIVYDILLFVGGLYLVAGVPHFLEGAMTMFASEAKKE